MEFSRWIHSECPPSIGKDVEVISLALREEEEK